VLFDPSPKEDPRDFFDQETELSTFVSAIERGERLIVVYGVRRVGKSSLVRVSLKMCSVGYLIISTVGSTSEELRSRKLLDTSSPEA